MLEKNKCDFENMPDYDKVEFFVQEIKIELENILNGNNKYCSCSYFPLRDLVKAAINGDLGINLRWIKFGDESSIRRLAELIVYNKL